MVDRDITLEVHLLYILHSCSRNDNLKLALVIDAVPGNPVSVQTDKIQLSIHAFKIHTKHLLIGSAYSNRINYMVDCLFQL